MINGLLLVSGCFWPWNRMQSRFTILVLFRGNMILALKILFRPTDSDSWILHDRAFGSIGIIVQFYFFFFYPKGKSRISPGLFMVNRAFSVSIRMALCWSLLKGSPKGWPRGCSRKTVRGGFIFSEMLRTIEIPTVGIPSFSILLWISPTDWLHIPQPGVRRTTSTLSSFNLRDTSGAVRLTSVGMCLPRI